MVSRTSEGSYCRKRELTTRLHNTRLFLLKFRKELIRYH